MILLFLKIFLIISKHASLGHPFNLTLSALSLYPTFIWRLVNMIEPTNAPVQGYSSNKRFFSIMPISHSIYFSHKLFVDNHKYYEVDFTHYILRFACISSEVKNLRGKEQTKYNWHIAFNDRLPSTTGLRSLGGLKLKVINEKLVFL